MAEVSFLLLLCWKDFDLDCHLMLRLEELRLLGALTDDCKLEKPAGEQMARLPLDPVYSRALILANQKC